MVRAAFSTRRNSTTATAETTWRGRDLQNGSMGQNHDRESNPGRYRQYHVQRRSGIAWRTVSDRDKQSALYRHYLDLARQALREDYNGIDPVGGRTQFNNRFDNYRGPRRMNGQSENLYQDFGPFENAGSKTNPSARIVIYDDAQPAATGSRVNGGKRRK